MTKTEERLFFRLKNLYNDKDFVVGVMSSVDDDSDAEAILSFIENGEDVTPENIILLALELDISHEKAENA